MNIVNQRSLASTIDTINEAFFYGVTIPKIQKQQVAKWIAVRQGQPRSYRGLFAPTEYDYKHGIKVFTGESIRSGAATGHILGEEALRALILLNVPIKSVRNALERANDNMKEVVKNVEQIYGNYGQYCCGTCSVAFWRNLAAGGLEDSEKRLKAGMKVLESYRDGNGRWRRHPFYYTLLALNEIDMPSAVDEMRYAAPILERVIKRKPRKDKYAQRRRVLTERILEKC